MYVYDKLALVAQVYWINIDTLYSDWIDIQAWDKEWNQTSIYKYII